MPKSGYFISYYTNETNVMVYLDNIVLSHRSGPLLQESDTYAFGGGIDALESRSFGRAENKYGYNGKEKQPVLGLEWLDYGARMYDAQVGRWGVVDPLASKKKNVFYSPYSYVINNPIIFIDPDGKDWEVTGSHKDKKGRTIIDVKFTGAVLNESGEKVNMNGLASAVKFQIKNSFNGKISDKFRLSVKSDIRVIKDEKELKTTEHLFRVLPNNDTRVEGAYAAVNKLGGKEININKDMVVPMIMGTDLNSIPHELGHTGYFFHPEVLTTTQGGTTQDEAFQIGSKQYFSPQPNGTNKRNMMYSGGSDYLNDQTSTSVNSDQRRALIVGIMFGWINQD